MPKAMNSATEPLAASALLASTQLVALDDRRQVGVVGDVEERRQDRARKATTNSWAKRQQPPSARDRDRAEQDGPAEVGPDHHRPPAEPVDPGAGDEPDHERRDELEAAQHGDLDRPGAEHEDRHERQRDPGDERAEDRDGRAPTRPGRTPRLRQSERRRTGRARRRSIAGRTGRAADRRVDGGPRRGLRYTPHASVRQNPRTTRTGRERRRPAGQPPTESRPDHVRQPQRPPAQDPRQPDRPRPDHRGRRRRRDARGPPGPARGRRQLQGRQGLRRARPRAGRSAPRSSRA